MSSAVIAIIRRVGAGDNFNDVVAYPDATLTDWITDARVMVPVSRLGNKANHALAYYTCHLMIQATSAVSSSGGGVKKEKAGAVEREYHQTTYSSSSSDKYLEMYLSISKNLIRTSPIVLNGN